MQTPDDQFPPGAGAAQRPLTLRTWLSEPRAEAPSLPEARFAPGLAYVQNDFLSIVPEPAFTADHRKAPATVNARDGERTLSAMEGLAMATINHIFWFDR
ncbi:MAG: hypothetical protein EAZ36_06930 [Verrucomicrobia bacterium]|nr:MAG: hypothetical protein EAZ36_06930 [Verrucomicrobiota bacterium]